MNGTVEGDDVWIPMSNILGGQERCGFGWHMFVECLAEGRGVSLPAGSAGCGRGVVSAVGAYTRVRKQFRVLIAKTTTVGLWNTHSPGEIVNKNPHMLCTVCVRCRQNCQ